MSTKPITVLGSFMADLVCRADRMPAWGETLRGNAFAVGPGGKGSNQAIAAARQGAKGVPNVLITLGENGVYVSSADFTGVIPAVNAGPVRCWPCQTALKSSNQK